MPQADAPPLTGAELHALVRQLYPLRRSITGEGVRETLRVVDAWAPVMVTEVPSGTRVYDWVIPPEWNVDEAFVADAGGRRIVDAADHALHLVGYSVPVEERMPGSALRPHLHALEDSPELIPYRTSYYERAWGFCVTGAQLAAVRDDEEYEVVIRSTLDEGGSLTYGELLVPGSGGVGEILLSAHVCHPALANDNAAAIAVAAGVARALAPGALCHDVRVVLAPGTVGALAWLHANEGRLDRIRAGLVLSCLGDPGPLHYKRSRAGDTLVDRAAVHVLARREGAAVLGFVPWGTDERQYNAPGFALPVGTLTRTPNGRYPEYHTSADDVDLVTPEALADSLDALLEIVRVVDADVTLERVEPRGEPQLSRHALEGRMTAGLLGGAEQERQALFWTLNLADGAHSLLGTAERAGLPFALVQQASEALLEAGLVREVAR